MTHVLGKEEAELDSILNTSIFDTIAQMLGEDPALSDFAVDIIVDINTSIAILTQLGVGPRGGFFITGRTETWTDFIGADNKLLEMAKTYIYAKTRIMFDPPQSSAALDAMKQICSELEWRINVAVDPGKSWKEVT